MCIRNAGQSANLRRMRAAAKRESAPEIASGPRDLPNVMLPQKYTNSYYSSTLTAVRATRYFRQLGKSFI
jgi:hypothetical protein